MFPRLAKLPLCHPHWKAGDDEKREDFHSTQRAWAFAKTTQAGNFSVKVVCFAVVSSQVDRCFVAPAHAATTLRGKLRGFVLWFVSLY